MPRSPTPSPGASARMLSYPAEATLPKHVVPTSPGTAHTWQGQQDPTLWAAGAERVGDPPGSGNEKVTTGKRVQTEPRCQVPRTLCIGQRSPGCRDTANMGKPGGPNTQTSCAHAPSPGAGLASWYLGPLPGPQTAGHLGMGVRGAPSRQAPLDSTLPLTAPLTCLALSPETCPE